MLSRVADSLYWMSRYLERAEHTARVINVHLDLMLEHGTDSDDRIWGRMLRALGIESDDEPQQPLSYVLAHTLIHDPDSSSSIVAWTPAKATNGCGATSARRCTAAAVFAARRAAKRSATSASSVSSMITR